MTGNSMNNDMERVLIDEEELNVRIAQLGEEISRDYDGKELVLVSVLKGGLYFLADISRKIFIHHQIELVGASSYKGSTHAVTDVRITKDIDLTLSGKHVLLVEDIYDTGNTLKVVYELLRMHKPASLEICALLNKPARHVESMSLKYVGFEIEDHFVIGYGLDYKEYYRNLPCIGILKAELYK